MPDDAPVTSPVLAAFLMRHMSALDVAVYGLPPVPPVDTVEPPAAAIPGADA
jgi:hypothetical protein